MENIINIKVDGNKVSHCIDKLYGVFFEDINHAADGGLYAEMIRNRSFEFCEIDNKEYHSLTGWDIKKEGDTVGEITVKTKEPLKKVNPHYAVISLESGKISLSNKGFNNGLFIEKDKFYDLAFYSRGKKSEQKIKVLLKDKDNSLYEKEYIVTDKWEKYTETIEGIFESSEIEIEFCMEEQGEVWLDFISLFPQDTYKGRKNGLRKDLAQAIEDLRPRFLRFPGGCLIHDGSLNKDDRDSLYRWKNTIGPLEERPARKNNWGYNQTLGLGYYEYFLFAEDLKATPLPVLPAAYNPHRLQAVPIGELKEWIDDALDLIEFANGDVSTEWGKIRSELGHPEPFGLEYIAIGNEELFYPFIERYPYFHNAIKEKYPEIKVISSSGPFADGYDFHYMWREANRAGADLVDEHFYMPPDWMLKHVGRYDNYNREGAKVFLGEYASLDNKYKNALYEAAFMTGIENNGDIVELACYAPLLCNKDYVNWKPDMIWFDNKQMVKTPNYHVQKMFMENQGDNILQVWSKGNTMKRIPIDNIYGKFGFESDNEEIVFSEIRVSGIPICKNVTLKKVDGKLTIDSDLFSIVTLEDGNKQAAICNMELQENSILEYDFVKTKGKSQLKVIFGMNENEYYCFEMGGWANDMSNLSRMKDNKYGGLNIGSGFILKEDEEWKASIAVKDGRHIIAKINNNIYQDFMEKETVIESLYISSAIERETGDVIVKCVNVENKDAIIELELDSEKIFKSAVKTELACDDLEKENTFEFPENIVPEKRSKDITDNTIKSIIKPKSVNVFRISYK